MSAMFGSVDTTVIRSTDGTNWQTIALIATHAMTGAEARETARMIALAMNEKYGVAALRADLDQTP